MQRDKQYDTLLVDTTFRDSVDFEVLTIDRTASLKMDQVKELIEQLGTWIGLQEA